MAGELYARYLDSSVKPVGIENYGKLEETGYLKKGEYYLVLYVDKLNDDLVVYLNVSGVRGLALNSTAFSFFTKENENFVPHDIYSDPEYNKEYDSKYYHDM